MNRAIYFEIFNDGSVEIAQETTVFEFGCVSEVREFISVCEMFVKQCEASASGEVWPNAVTQLPEESEGKDAEV